jgi:hypothetical protein
LNRVGEKNVLKMKKIVLALLCFTSVCASAQKESFVLSEEESKQIAQSPEFQNVFSYQNQFLDKIDLAVKKGTPLSVIKKAAVEAIQSGNNASAYSILFGTYSEGDDFFKEMANAKKEFLEKNPTLKANADVILCKTCKQSPEEEISVLFDKFQSHNTYRFNPQDDIAGKAAAEPTCGSWWNQIKLAACVTLCSASTVGIGTAACGWGCWCTFCSQNSALASVICAN